MLTFSQVNYIRLESEQFQYVDICKDALICLMTGSAFIHKEREKLLY